jgi:hypothetical protein
MRPPEDIEVRVVSAEAVDLGDLIIEMVVSTGQRNPRHLLFPKTDSSGMSYMRREDFINQFKDATDFDLMGSWGGILEALPRVQVSLYDPQPALAVGSRSWPLGEHERTKWQTPAAEYAYRVSCRNLEFQATPLEVDLHHTSSIVFPVRWAPRGKQV